MKTEQIHDIIRAARTKYYDLDDANNGYQYMCICVHALCGCGEITHIEYREVEEYIGSLIGAKGRCKSLTAYLLSQDLKSKDLKAAQLKFWDDLLGEKE